MRVGRNFPAVFVDVFFVWDGYQPFGVYVPMIRIPLRVG